MMGTYRTLNDYEMQHKAGVGLFTKPSIFAVCQKAFSGIPVLWQDLERDPVSERPKFRMNRVI
jgi:hypothetical protein